MKLKPTPWISFLTLALSVSLGCQAIDDGSETVLDDDVSSIESALEQENGGFDFEDESAMFGAEAAFEAAELDEEADVEDPTEAEPEVVDMMNRPDALLVHTRLIWGQFPFNPDVEAPTNWSGQFSINRGAIVIRRTIAFDPITDHLLPRADRKVVNFTSATGPHVDGLALTIIDPTPLAEEPLVLSYATPNTGAVLSVPVKELNGTPQELVTAELGNRLVAVAVAEARDLCNHGFLAGRWHKVAEGRGIMLGRVRGVRGALLGHMRGIYGVREDGSKVFFGKYIGRAGEFGGIYAGTYADGAFQGRWLVRSGEAGRLKGRYDETVPGPRVGGMYNGRWAEATCDRPAGAPEEDPSDSDPSAGN